MQLGNRAAVSTKALTASFGWCASTQLLLGLPVWPRAALSSVRRCRTAADSFHQHDVHELNRVLFDALQLSSPEVFGHLNTLYTGKLIDYIQDKRWPADGAARRSRDDSYMDVHLAVSGSSSVAHALRRYVTPELMDGANQWECDDKGTKVRRLLQWYGHRVLRHCIHLLVRACV